uniref:F-actin-capping protein subunit beta (Fragments) n=1 Tax=Mesocricetus auratus TaxID=10036 RepID=CAPZB_MESAU|nr:RecName: Full=F-actin-capping protein subunit beta; AltName: Full=CapZ beta [Mesocricetus auratus]
RLPPQQIEKSPWSNKYDPPLEDGAMPSARGCWDSIHVVEVQEKSGSGTMNLGGSLTRQMEKDETVSDCSPHIANIGRLVEDMENKIRSTLNEIYFGK